MDSGEPENAPSHKRHDFTGKTAQRLGERVGARCSNPNCRAPTKGPHSEGERAVSVGMACHIHAAAPGGPRYDPAQLEDERRSIHNGIWLCRSCGTLIDADAERFPAPLLRAWRAEAELSAFNELGKPAALASAPRDEVFVSEEAAARLVWLRDAYVERGFPNHKAWSFSSSVRNERTYSELRALGMVEPMGAGGQTWRLTDAGLDWVMRTRSR